MVQPEAVSKILIPIGDIERLKSTCQQFKSVRVSAAIKIFHSKFTCLM